MIFHRDMAISRFSRWGRPPSWNCFVTIHHPRSLCCWPQLPVKFHVNLIRRSEDIAIEVFAYLAWNAYSGPKMGVLGDFGPLNVIIHHRDPQKAHPCVNPRLLSYQLYKNPLRGLTCIVELTESVTDTQTDRQTHTGKFIFCACIALDRQRKVFPHIRLPR